MSSHYQKSMEALHAPSNLVERTKEQMREADRKSGRIIAFPQWKAVSAAAAALVLTAALALLWNTARTPVFTVLPAAVSEEAPGNQYGLIDHARRKVSVQEFDEAFGTSLSVLATEDFSAWLTRDPQGEAETGEASFRYLGCTVRAAKGEGGLLPGELTEGKAQELSGVPVYLARRETGGELLAGFVQKDMEWLVSATDLGEKAFVAAVAELITGGEGMGS